jgi:hypothetical protein
MLQKAMASFSFWLRSGLAHRGGEVEPFVTPGKAMVFEAWRRVASHLKK